MIVFQFEKKKIFLYTMPLTSSQQKYLRLFGYITTATSVIWVVQDLFETVQDNKYEIGWLDHRLKRHAGVLEKIQNDLELKK